MKRAKNLLRKRKVNRIPISIISAKDLGLVDGLFFTTKYVLSNGRSFFSKVDRRLLDSSPSPGEDRLKADELNLASNGVERGALWDYIDKTWRY